jgi:SAM-dependent methyltransferase
MRMSETAGGIVPAAGTPDAARFYQKDFWSTANLKFGEPWYRMQKAARLLNKLAARDGCTLLDIGCGPGALQRLLGPGVDYYGIDIAIQQPAPNLREADLVETPIGFDGRSFDFVVAQGVFEYLGAAQSQKFAEIAEVLAPGGRFLVSYTNFGHRKPRIYEAFSNVQPLGEFRRDLERHFVVNRSFPASHNWKHSQPDKELVKAVNMHVSVNVPVISRLLAVDYFFLCSPRSRLCRPGEWPGSGRRECGHRVSYRRECGHRVRYRSERAYRVRYRGAAACPARHLARDVLLVRGGMVAVTIRIKRASPDARPVVMNSGFRRLMTLHSGGRRASHLGVFSRLSSRLCTRGSPMGLADVHGAGSRPR